MSNFKQIELEYVYVTIPADYICVYHRILSLLADYGIEMLQDCKASCSDKNSGVIECFKIIYDGAEATLRIRQLNNKLNLIIEEYSIYIKNKVFNH